MNFVRDIDVVTLLDVFGYIYCCGHIAWYILVNIGPSGVRALPSAAGINEGGHYCQAQLKL